MTHDSSNGLYLSTPRASLSLLPSVPSCMPLSLSLLPSVPSCIAALRCMSDDEYEYDDECDDDVDDDDVVWCMTGGRGRGTSG